MLILYFLQNQGLAKGWLSFNGWRPVEAPVCSYSSLTTLPSSGQSFLLQSSWDLGLMTAAWSLLQRKDTDYS